MPGVNILVPEFVVVFWGLIFFSEFTITVRRDLRLKPARILKRSVNEHKKTQKKLLINKVEMLVFYIKHKRPLRTHNLFLSVRQKARKDGKVLNK